MRPRPLLPGARSFRALTLASLRTDLLSQYLPAAVSRALVETIFFPAIDPRPPSQYLSPDARAAQECSDPAPRATPAQVARFRPENSTEAGGGEPLPCGGYRPITVERAERLAYLVAANLQSEALTHAFVELLEGLTAAAYVCAGDVECIATGAQRHAFLATDATDAALDEFKRRRPLDLADYRNDKIGRVRPGR